MGNQQDFLLMSMFVLGLRHGFDWDHLAALADISSVSSARGFWLCFLYAAGHAAVVLALGLLAVQAGARLPSWLDAIMEPVVGATLIALALWLIYTMWRCGAKFTLPSRLTLLTKLLTGPRPMTDGTPATGLPAGTSAGAALTTGVVHGIGAETPTQILALLAAASAAHGVQALALVCTFVCGILASNLLLAAFFVKGFALAGGQSWLNLSLGVLTAVFSLAVGVTFLTHSSALLPPLSGA